MVLLIMHFCVLFLNSSPSRLFPQAACFSETTPPQATFSLQGVGLFSSHLMEGAHFSLKQKHTHRILMQQLAYII